MSEQIINITSGFYDAVNEDRLYSADQMNMPYKRLISNGVFATPAGTPSTDFQVSAVSGMNLKVTHGNAILGDKWVESASDVNVTVPDSTGLTARIDSVILQVDRTPSGRAANIIYRTGTSQPPALNDSAGIYEFRLANIDVASGAVSITNENIEDARGSSECPWITSLIQQVDTSELYRQWQTAYRDYYQKTTTFTTEFIEQQEQAWNDFFDHATHNFTVVSYFKFTSSYLTSESSTQTIPINISIYEKDTDLLNVYINGLYAAEGLKYTIDENGENIILANALTTGQNVYFECLHAVTPSNVGTVIAMINSMRTNDIVPMQEDITELQGNVSELQTHFNDSGWIEAQLDGYPAGSVIPAYRKLNGVVHLRGTISCVSGTGKNYRLDPFFTLPAGFRPPVEQYFTAFNAKTSAVSTSETAVNPVPVPMKIDTNGNVSVFGMTAGDTFHLGTANAGWVLTLNAEFVL